MSREIERKLNYPFDERTRFSVRIEKNSYSQSAPEPVVSWIRGLTTLKFAQLAYIDARDASGLDGAGFAAGEIYDQAGQHVARVTFNGTMWPPLPFSAELEPVAEAPAWPGTPAEATTQGRELESPELREMIFDITDQRSLVPSFKPTSPADGRFPSSAKEWARVYGALYSYDSAIDAAGFETEDEMRAPQATRTVVMVKISDDGTIKGTWLGSEFSFTPAQVFAHFGETVRPDVAVEEDLDENLIWMTGTPESILQDAYTAGPDNAYQILAMQMKDGEILVGKDRHGTVQIVQEKGPDGLTDVPGGIQEIMKRVEDRNDTSDPGFEP